MHYDVHRRIALLVLDRNLRELSKESLSLWGCKRAAFGVETLRKIHLKLCRGANTIDIISADNVLSNKTQEHVSMHGSNPAVLLGSAKPTSVDVGVPEVDDCEATTSAVERKKRAFLNATMLRKAQKKQREKVRAQGGRRDWSGVGI
ncbi:hypothetical protein B0H10DRAFT_1969553 [Mycena sp. CBHHK59/15]|nr:hypothetical protein B0H10DRAFT_1969553 [Mycena sp. CBHHK59/15]